MHGCGSRGLPSTCCRVEPICTCPCRDHRCLLNPSFRTLKGLLSEPTCYSQTHSWVPAQLSSVIYTFSVMILISIGKSHRLRKQSMSAPLRYILLSLYVIATIVFDQKLKRVSTNAFLLGGLAATVMRAVDLVGRHLVII